MSTLQDLEHGKVTLRASLLRLDSAIRVKHVFNDPRIFIDGFCKHYENIELPAEIKVPHSYKPGSEYFSSRVAYTQVEHASSSKGKAYSKPKNNTYYLCAYCFPFEKAMHKETRDGEMTISDLPKFYDSLHSEFTHHMTGVHGINNKNGKVLDPFIVFSKSKLNKKSNSDFEYALSSICPYGDASERKACLAEFALNCKLENPFKSYLRHVKECHGEHPKHSKINRYSALAIDHTTGNVVPNRVIPVDKEQYKRTLMIAMQNCGNRAIDIECCEDENLLRRAQNCVKRDTFDTSSSKKRCISDDDNCEHLCKTARTHSFSETTPHTPDSFADQDTSDVNSDIDSSSMTQPNSLPARSIGLEELFHFTTDHQISFEESHKKPLNDYDIVTRMNIPRTPDHHLIGKERFSTQTTEDFNLHGLEHSQAGLQFSETDGFLHVLQANFKQVYDELLFRNITEFSGSTEEPEDIPRTIDPRIL